MYEKTFPNKRFKKTIEFLEKHVSDTESILDLGVVNPFTKIMQECGYSIENTQGEDLDTDTSTIENSDAIIKGSEELPTEIEEFLKTSDKPVLDYFHVSEFDTAYTEFYLNKVL